MIFSQADDEGRDCCRPTSRAARLDIFLRDVPWVLFVIGLVGIGSLKAGVHLLGTPAALESWPAPLPTAESISYGNRSIAFILGWEFAGAYAAISLFVSGAALVALGFILRPGKYGVDGRLLAIVIILGPIGQVLMTNVGGHDAWMFLGALVTAAFGRKAGGVAIGVVLMSLGNPEQAVIAMGCLLFITFIPNFKERRQPAFFGLILAIAFLVALSLYATLVGVSTRGGYIEGYLLEGLNNFFINFPLSLFAVLGISWIVVGWVLADMSNRNRFMFFVGVIAVPLLFTAITVDQTRVFVGLSSAALMTVLLDAVPRMHKEVQIAGLRNALCWTFLLAVLLPAVLITYTGHASVPYAWVFGKIGAMN